MIIRFQAPSPWWSRGVQLLWLMPQGQVVSAGDRWDLSLRVCQAEKSLRLVFEDRRERVERVVPMEPAEYLRAIFTLLSDYLGRPLSPWGVLTGVRPGKIAAGLLDGDGEAFAADQLVANWLLHEEKARLLVRAVENGYPLLKKDGLSIYVSVPFCPSRCDYCSFASLPIDRWRGEVGDYVTRGAAELREILKGCRENGIAINSVYVGGGTPTALNPAQLAELLAPVAGLACEFTVEAGRPDSLEADHLRLFRAIGVNRTSINAQYPLDATLTAIGRKHTVAQFYRALDMALAAGLTTNSDLIVGLPGQTPTGFAQAISRLATAGAQSITVHALAIKRGAKLNAQYLSFDQARGIGEAGSQRLQELGYLPYYLYRQRNIASNMENVGYGTAGSFCYYNIASIAEKEPVLGVGAGAVSKLVREGSFQVLVNPRDVNQYGARWRDLLAQKLTWLRGGSLRL